MDNLSRLEELERELAALEEQNRLLRDDYREHMMDFHGIEYNVVKEEKGE